MTLQEAFEKNRPFKFKFMVEAYDTLIRMIGGPDTIQGLLEIGVWRGGSLRMWRDALPNARIFGVDKSYDAVHHKDRRITIHVVDQTDSERLEEIACQIDVLDIVVDDGSHQAKDQLDSFLAVYRFVRPGGLYVCEDCAYNYDKKYAPQGQLTISDLASEVGCFMQVKAVDRAKKESPELDTDVIHCGYERRTSFSSELVELLVNMTNAVMFFPSLVVFQRL